MEQLDNQQIKQENTTKIKHGIMKLVVIVAN